MFKFTQPLRPRPAKYEGRASCTRVRASGGDAEGAVRMERVVSKDGDAFGMKINMFRACERERMF